MKRQLENVSCTVCSARSRWAHRGKHIICGACGSRYVEMPDGSLALAAKANLDTKVVNRTGSARRALRTGSPL